MSSLFSLAKSGLGKFIVSLGFTTPLSKILPVKKVYEDDQVLAFYHPKPFWEIHIVIVPKTGIVSLDTLKPASSALMGHICLVAARLVKELNLVNQGYRLLTNGGRYQKVKYMHFHLGAGRQLQTDEDGSNNSTPREDLV